MDLLPNPDEIVEEFQRRRIAFDVARKCVQDLKQTSKTLGELSGPDPSFLQVTIAVAGNTWSSMMHIEYPVIAHMLLDQLEAATERLSAASADLQAMAPRNGGGE